MAPAETDLVELARRIRTVWIHEHRAFIERVTQKPCRRVLGTSWDGGRDASGRLRPNAWRLIAEMVLKESLDYEMLIRAVFKYHTLRTAPSPTLAYTSTGRARYFRYLESDRSDPLKALSLQIDEFQRAMFHAEHYFQNPDDAVAYVLGDVSLGLSALFRYSVAERQGLTEVAKFWKPEAKLLYLTRKAEYDETWGSCIPTQLMEN